jgi:hypothetical protein
MLFCLVSWILLTASAAIVGSAILAILKGPIFHHFGDRVITAIWLGLLIFATTLLGLSIILPVTPGISFGLVAALTAMAGCSKSGRNLLGTSPSCLTNSFVAGICIFAATAALNSTRLVQLVDTGLYHYQLVRWLSEYGTVLGLALIHSRLGFSSSWFALAAPFDFGPFQGRISGLLDGLVIFLALLHFTLAVSRILQRRADRADWFLAGGYPLIFLVCFSWAFEVSLSPDVPGWILTLIIGWLMLFAGRPGLGRDPKARSDHSCILPLILAFGAMSIKLSAAPTVIVAGLFFWFNSVGKWNTRLVIGAIASFVAVPLFAANIASSGCPLYPSSPMCLDLQWGIGKGAVKLIAGQIGDFARWGGPIPSGATAWSWVPTWISQMDKLVLLPLCAVCLVGFGAVRGWRRDRAFLWVLALSLTGMALVFTTAPNPRFALGYLTICPALFVAVIGPELRDKIRCHFMSRYKPTRLISLASLLIGVSGLMALQAGVSELRIRRKIDEFRSLQTPLESGSWNRLLLPPALPQSSGDLMVVKSRQVDGIGGLQLIDERSNGIEYHRPLAGEQCWAVALPCLPASLEGDVHLRRPDHGLRFGFIRSTDSPNKAPTSLE